VLAALFATSGCQQQNAQPQGGLHSSETNEEEFHANVEVFDPSTGTYHQVQSTGDGPATVEMSGLVKQKAHREDLLNSKERVAVASIMQKLREGRAADFTHDEKMAVDLLKPQQWMSAP